MKELFDDITLRYVPEIVSSTVEHFSSGNRMARWRFKLDTNLPGELGQLADWINAAEEVLNRELNFEPMNLSPEENVTRFNELNEEYTVRKFDSNETERFTSFFFVT
jgi:hypothetical protein